MKLLVREQGSEVAKSLFAAATMLFTASIGYVEARSALGREARAGHLKGTRYDRALTELERVWLAASVVHLDRDLVARAGDVSELQGLTAGDAIHLTSALVLGDPELTFATWDEALGRAAREVGLAVAP
ncbi:MAG: type II toxin-antitoxin system VapC family toxin [Actinobacteria bacterium]|nr:type II toxin-antitoxin system VapC family toxin [Actinomycetota bacterium]